MLRRMTDNDNDLIASEAVIDTIKAELEKASPTRKQLILQAITLAALGSIPWVGGVLSVAATYKFNESSIQGDTLRDQWLNEHRQKLLSLRETLEQIIGRLEKLGDEIDERIASPQYLALVPTTFRQWDHAETEQKRHLLVQFITNAAGTRICSDDILRLFLSWIDSYHEAHFAVIREIFKNPGPTRYDIWVEVYGSEVPRDDSAEADLYKMLIGDLSMGRVIRQPGESDAQGRFRRKIGAPRRMSSGTMESPFEDTKQYVLTELGKQFVHYTMTELVSRLNPGAADGTPA